MTKSKGKNDQKGFSEATLRVIEALDGDVAKADDIEVTYQSAEWGAYDSDYRMVLDPDDDEEECIVFSTADEAMGFVEDMTEDEEDER